MENTIENTSNQIFEKITQTIISSDFKIAQAEFFENNCSSFKNEEENTHEHNQIFKEYQQILETSIESKLLETFTENQIAQFFEYFEKNHLEFKKVNTDTVETLFVFTEFDNFKKTMIDYNTRLNNKSEDQSQKKIITNEEIKNIIDNFDKYVKKDKKEWKQVVKSQNQDEMQIYSTPFEKTGVDLVLCEWVIKNVSLQALINSTLSPNLEIWREKEKMIEVAEYLEKNQNDNIVHYQFKMPMMSSREYLWKQELTKQDNSYVIYSYSIDLPEVQPKKGVVRALVVKKCYFQQLQDKTWKVAMYQFQDLKGYIPKMFLNMMMAKMGKGQIEVYEKTVHDEEERLNKIKK